MADQTTICNMALSHLGSESLVVNIDPPDGSVEAGYCATFYQAARAEALSMGNWPWAKKRVALAQITNVSSVWAYAYEVPSDCLNPLRVLPAQTAPSPITYSMPWEPGYQTIAGVGLQPNEDGSADFETEGSTLFTHEPDAVLVYTFDQTDSSKFSPGFTLGFSMLLASYLAGPIIKGNPAIEISARWRKQAETSLAKAAANDANGSSSRIESIPDHIRARA